MNHITQMSNWGYYDALDDVALLDGDQLRVRWPDGTVTEEVVRIHHAATTIQDQGRACEIPFDSAYVEKVYCGLTVAIWLRQPTPMLFCEKTGATHR